MTQYTDDLDAMTGLDNGSTRLVLNMLSLNGDAEIVETDGKYETKGGFYRLLHLKGAKKDEKPLEEKLGESVSVVFLKIRRALQQRSSDGALVKWTNEHSTADDIVELHTKDSQTVTIGSARSLREDNPELRTIQYVYALFFKSMTEEPELVKIRIKGASLGSDAKDKDVPTFYDYIYADRKDEEGKKEHLRHYITELGRVKEEGKKSYFAMTFNRGAKLDEALCGLADSTLREVHEKIKAADQAVQKRIAALDKPKSVTEPSVQMEDGIEYPTAQGENINPEDIPF
jgi:hypothetical protein